MYLYGESLAPQPRPHADSYTAPLGFSAASHATHLLNSIKTVSMVFSRFHCARHGSCLGSTMPLRESTQGRLTWLTNWIVGGTSGYFSPQCILTL